MMRTAIFLSSLLFLSCSKYPFVTLHSLDTKNSVAYRYKITKYNKESCELELEDQPIIPINDVSLNGAVCVTKEDYSKLQTKAKADCKNDNKWKSYKR